MLSQNEIRLVALKIAREIKPEKIILFGSYAYGNPTEDSDVDLCIVEKSYKSKMEEKRKIRELLEEIRVGKDILVPSLEEYNFYKNEPCSVYKDIEDRGIILWQKS